MNEPLTITTERVDDIPLLIAHMQRMCEAFLLSEDVCSTLQLAAL